jgi:hypothetical protein
MKLPLILEEKQQSMDQIENTKVVIKNSPAVQALFLQYDEYFGGGHLMNALKTVLPHLFEGHKILRIMEAMIPMWPEGIDLTAGDYKVRLITSSRSAFPEFSPDGKMMTDQEEGHTVYSSYMNVVIFFLADSQKTINGFIDHIKKEHHLAYTGNLPIYRWTNPGEYSKTSNTCRYNPNDLKGLDTVYGEVKRLVLTYKEKKPKLDQMGVTSGLNILFYGPPGVGKTSVVKALVSDLELDMYVASLNSNPASVIPAMLIPSVKKLSVVLAEDFDRYMANGSGNNGSTGLSEILNSLDGVESGVNIIRIFSANDPDIIMKCNAMASRMHVFKFDYPSKQSLADQILNVFPNCSDKLVTRFVETLPKNVSNRDLNLFMAKYLHYECETDPDRPILEMNKGWSVDD